MKLVQLFLVALYHTFRSVLRLYGLDHILFYSVYVYPLCDIAMRLVQLQLREHGHVEGRLLFFLVL